MICPSEDARARLERHGLADRGGRGAARAGCRRPLGAGSAAAARAASCAWRCWACWRSRRARRPSSPWPRRRIPQPLELHLIGYAEDGLPETVRDRIVVSGEYAEADLPGLLARVKPHVVWFPAQWPETYSYTLSAAIDAGLPVVASRIGAFVERLEGRPLSWLVDPRASPEEWLRCFDVGARGACRAVKAARADLAAGCWRISTPDNTYLPATGARPRCSRHGGEDARGGLVDLRRPGRTSIVVVPEQLDNDEFSPAPISGCCSRWTIRRSGRASTSCWPMREEALRYRADIVATQRYAVPDMARRTRWPRIAAGPGRRWPTTSTTTCCTSRVTIRTRRCCGRRPRWCSACCATPARCSSPPPALAASLASVRTRHGGGAERAG